MEKGDLFREIMMRVTRTGSTKSLKTLFHKLDNIDIPEDLTDIVYAYLKLPKGEKAEFWELLEG